MSSQASHPRLAAVVLAAFAAANFASAAAITWQGNTSGVLTLASNWGGGVAPVTATDAYVFGAAGTAGTSLTLGSGFSATNANGGLSAIEFAAGASAYTFGGGGQLTAATGGMRNLSGQTQTFNNPFRFNTGSGHFLLNANSAFVFNGVTTLQAATTTFTLGGATGHAITFGGNLSGSAARILTLTGSTNASTVAINGSANTDLGTLNIGSNVRVNLGSATGLGSATLVTMNGGGATLANTSGSALTTNASLAFNTATQNHTFGATGHTAANNLTFNGTTVISADLNRTITLNGTGLSVTSGSVWNNSSTTSRQLTVNGPGNTLGLGGVAIGATGEAANVTFTLAGSANLTVSGGVTNGLGTGTRGLQHNGSGVLTIEGASDYSGTTGVGTNATLLVNGSHTGGLNYSVAGTLGGSGTIDLSANNATVGFFSGGTGRLQASSTETLTFIGGTNPTINLTNSINSFSIERLLFTLGNPGGTVVDVQGILTIGTGLLDWNDFSFTPGSGFGTSTYNLFQYDTLNGTMGTSLTGMIGGFNATMSNDVLNKSIVLSVVPEPTTSAFASLLLASALLRRSRQIF